MPREKNEQAEQIIPKHREVEVEAGREKTGAETAEKIGVTELTFYRWKKRRRSPACGLTKPSG